MTAIDTEHLTDDAPDTTPEDSQPDVDDTPATDVQTEDIERRERKAPRRLSISVRAAVLTAVMIIFAGTAGVFGWLYLGANERLTAQEHDATQRAHAEEVAIDYAVNAAEMDYQDFNSWKIKLINGTSPELKEKLTKAADSMQQILVPLQWKSTGRPLIAKVRSESGGIYIVDSFVSVLTKTIQAPDGLQSTATYSITLDSKNNWQITDVGGIDAALRK